MICSINQFTLKSEIPQSKWKQITQVISDIFIESETLNRNPMIIRRYTSRIWGIKQIETREISIPERIERIYTLSVKVNPFELIHKTTGFLIEPEYIEKAIQIIQNELSFLPDKIIKNFKLENIVLGCSLTFSSVEDVKEYMNLLQLSFHNKHMEKWQPYYDFKHGNKINTEYFVLKCQHYELTVYSIQNFSIPTQAQGNINQINITLNATQEMIHLLSSKYDIFYLDDHFCNFLCAAPKIAQDEITDIFSKLIGTGDFLPYQYTKWKIIHSNFLSDSQKDAMLDTIYFFSCKKLDQDFIAYHQYTYKEWKAILRYFNKLGISPITTPARFHTSRYYGVKNWQYL